MNLLKILTGENPVPTAPSRRAHYHRSRGGTGCCCLDCICDCVFGCILSIICTVLVLVGLVVLVLYLIVRPHAIDFHVTSATLAQFALPAATTLSYNLSLTFSARNPNRHLGIYYDDIEVRNYFLDQIFATTTIPGFYQGHKNTTFLGPVGFVGTNTVSLGSGDLKEFNTERSDGVFKISVRLNLSIRFKIWFVKTGHYKPRVDCDLKVPLEGASSGVAFESTKCHYHL